MSGIERLTGNVNKLTLYEGCDIEIPSLKVKHLSILEKIKEGEEHTAKNLEAMRLFS